MERFGEKLRNLRQRNGLSLRKVGEILGVYHTHISQVEHGLKPSVELIIKIANLFKVTTDQLMRDELEVD